MPAMEAPYPAVEGTRLNVRSKRAARWTCGSEADEGHAHARGAIGLFSLASARGVRPARAIARLASQQL